MKTIGHLLQQSGVLGAPEQPTTPLFNCGVAPAAPPVPQRNELGWPVPSSLATDPTVARAMILLPEFEPLLLEKARVVSGRYPLAEAEYRRMRTVGRQSEQADIPHFERVFRIAAKMASLPNACNEADYDALLILAAWHTVRPQQEGFLGSYPKSLLCSLSHLASPAALASLSPAEQAVFDRRAPVYLRYLLCDKFGLRTCAELESADLRHLLRSAGFRLIRSSAVAEVAFPGITCGEDPPVRPWKLTLRQELSDDRAASMLLHAALWKLRYDLRLVTGEGTEAKWNIGAFGRTDWEDAFLSLGVRVPPGLTRDSGLLDWRSILGLCLERIGRGNLPEEVLGKVLAWPQRICHDDRQSIWEGLDNVARNVVEQVRSNEPGLFTRDGKLNCEAARSYRRWARLFDEVSPQVLSRFGISAFTALHRVAPEFFGWEPAQLKPWEIEQEHGKWKGPRGRALLRSAYAFALYETGLGRIVTQEEQVLWQCTSAEFSAWYSESAGGAQFKPYEFLYGIASRHGLTPILSREMSHTAAVSLLAGMNLHQGLPRIEGCWALCMQTAIEHHSGQLEVRLVIPDLVPLPLRLRKAVLAHLPYSYLHKEPRFVREFDLRMARETRRSLEDLPGWWEDERIAGTPLLERMQNLRDPTRAVLTKLRPEPWLEPPTRRIRFRALYLLLSKRAVILKDSEEGGLASEEMRHLLRLSLEAALDYTNVAQVSLPAIRRGFERLLARDDTREMLDSLLLHIGAAYETEVWGQVRKFIVLDVVNDVLMLAVRGCLLHLMSDES